MSLNIRVPKIGRSQFEHLQFGGTPTRGYMDFIRKQRFLLSIGIIIAIIISSMIIVAVSFNLKKEMKKICSTELQCLPLNLCDTQIIPNDTLPCGNRKNYKICCKPKQITRSKFDVIKIIEERTDKIEKMRKCGIADLTEKTAFGEDVSLGQLPWMAVLGYTDHASSFSHYKCSGTLINERYILTAAHCTNMEHFTLKTATLGFVDLRSIPNGEECEYGVCHEISTIPVEKIITHPNYNSKTQKDDIALVRLEKGLSELNDTDFIRPICLPFGIVVEDYLKHKNFSIAAWGRTHKIGTPSDILQITYKMQPWENDKCSDKMNITKLQRTQICASSELTAGACIGDSGGPLMYEIQENKTLYTVQFGITSYKFTASCGTLMEPSVFTRVDKYLEWILDNIDI